MNTKTGAPATRPGSHVHERRRCACGVVVSACSCPGDKPDRTTRRRCSLCVGRELFDYDAIYLDAIERGGPFGQSAFRTTRTETQTPERSAERSS